MSHENNSDISKVVDQPAMSQLSVDAACFVPTYFQQSVASTSDEVPTYFDGYVWQGTRIKDPSPYLSGLGQWPLGHPYGNPGIQPPFHYGQYPPTDYWPVTLGNENLASRIIGPEGQTPDTFNSSYSNISWNTLPSQEASVLAGLSTRRSKLNGAKDPSRMHPQPTESAVALKDQSNSSSAVPSSGEPVRTKRKKKKSRSIIRIEASSEVNQGGGGLTNAEIETNVRSIDGKREKSVEAEENKVHGNTSRTSVDSLSPQEGSKAYKDNDAQTDFSEEFSRLTLSERPSSLYELSTSPDFFKSFDFTGNSADRTVSASGTVQVKPLLWTAIVSQTAVHPTGKAATSEINMPSDTNLKSKADQFAHHGLDYKKKEKKVGFDHSSVRSQSGKRMSTGISTSDQKQNQSSSDKAKHEYPSGRHDFSLGRQKDLSEKSVTMTSGRKLKYETQSLSNVKQDVSVDGKRTLSAGSSIKSQRVSKTIGGDFPSSIARTQRQSSKEHGTNSFGVSKKKEENHTPSMERYEERGLRNGQSRSPSWKRSQTVGSSSRSKTAELSRSVSGGRIPTTGGMFPVKGKSAVDKNKLSQQKSLKTGISQHNGLMHDETASEAKLEVKVEGTAKRRRKNKKKKMGAKEDGEVGEKDLGVGKAVSLSVGPSVLMQFNNDDEFPGLLSAAEASMKEILSGPIKYSDILSGRAKTPSRIYASNQLKSTTKERTPVEDESDWDLDVSTSQQKESRQDAPQQTKSARSISQPPKSTSKPTLEKRAVGAGAKTKEPITLSLFDMITVKSKNKKTPEKDEDKKPLKTGTQSNKKAKSGNVLDSSGVQVRRGKEREVPKAKKPSLLRKVILKERESRRQKFLKDCMRFNDKEENLSSDLTADVCTDGLRRHASAPSYISGPRVASRSPSAAEDVTAQQDDIPASEAKDSHMEMLQSMIHSRRFREYCTQVLSKEIDDCCMLLLQELVRFQDRLYHKDPNKARLKRRIVLGLREVTKHLKARRIKCVIISPNLERIQSKGGLDEALHNIIEMCQLQNIPFIFALSRKQLGKACCKIVPVSVVGIFSYEGAEEHFKRLKDLTEKARDSYKEMVSNLATELEELGKMYPDSSWPVDGNICGEETSENMLNCSPGNSYANGNVIVGGSSEETCSLSSCRTLGDAQDQFSPGGLVNLVRQPMRDEDSYTNPSDSAHKSRLTDSLITETESKPSLETGQVRENGGNAEETFNNVTDTLCPSGIEFSLANT